MKWVESAGARVVPIKVADEGSGQEDYLLEMFKGVSGLLLPGGGSSITNSSYAFASNFMFKLAIQVFMLKNVFLST